MRITVDNVMDQLKRGDPEALAFLIDQYSPAMQALASHILAGAAGPEDIEECISDVFVRVWNESHKYEPNRGTVRTWLLVLTKYGALNRRREAGRQHQPELVEESEIDPVRHEILSRERQEQLAALIAQMDSPIRDVLIRRYLLGMPIPDIAAVMGLSRSTVDNRLSRGRKELRQRWDHFEEEGGAKAHER